MLPTAAATDAGTHDEHAGTNYKHNHGSTNSVAHADDHHASTNSVAHTDHHTSTNPVAHTHYHANDNSITDASGNDNGTRAGYMLRYH